MRTLAPLVLVALVGCGDDGSPGPVDTPAGSDAGGVDGAIDGGNLPACTGAAYDPCTGDNTQCMSNNCRLFQGAGLQICTQACDANTPCPTQNGQAVQCNGMGVCRPNAANVCMR